MAKTRSQSKGKRQSSTMMPGKSSKLSQNLKETNSKQKTIKVPYEFQKCRVRLTKLDPKEINFLLHGKSTNRHDECVLKNKYDFRKRAPSSIIIPKTSNKSTRNSISNGILHCKSNPYLGKFKKRDC